MSETVIQDTPPVKIERNAFGLIQGVDYTFNEDGTVNWRAMVKPEHLVPNRQLTTETDITKLKDNQLLILLLGTRHLAELRGYTSITYPTVICKDNKVTVVCRIHWKPNYETEMQEVVTEGIGDASYENTDDMTRFYLGPIAENRAFVRCVRAFLKIGILSKEEIANKKLAANETSAQTSQSSAPDPKSMLKEIVEKKDIPFSKIKARLVKMGVEGAEEFTSIDEIPKSKFLELIELANNYAPSKKNA